MKRQTLLFLVCVLTLFAAVQKVGAATVYSTEVDGVTFYFTVDGTEATICNSGGTSSKTTSYTNESIAVPSSVTYDGTTYTVTAIGAYAFYQCSSLASITLPSTVTSIGNYAFYGCSSLTSVTLPSTVTSIGNYAFYGCSSLTSITLPSSVTSIGYCSFRDCTALTSIDLSQCTSLTTLTGAYAGGCFHGCTALTNVTLSSSVTSLGKYCFYGCTSLESIDISNVTELDMYCFQNCSSLAGITLSSSVTSLPTSCFSGCSKLTSESLCYYDSGKQEQTGLSPYITTLGVGCFSGCTLLTSIDISNITSLGAYCFSGCTSLTSVGLPYNESVTSLSGLAGTTKAGMFSDCTALTSESLYYYDSDNQKQTGLSPYITTLGVYCFSGCTALESIDISNITSLGTYCFNGCTALTSIEISSGVTTLPDHGFYQCKKLTSIKIPNTVTTLASCCFRNCTSLTSIEIPSSVTWLDTYCFANCTGLTSIEIPSSVTIMSNYCFYYCTALTKVKVYAESVPTLGTTAFDSNADGRIIYVPPFSLANYQAASNWSSYASYINPFVDQTVSGEAGMGTIALPFDATIPDGLTVHTLGDLSEDGTEVALTAVSSGETLAAGTPCIVVISDEEETDDTATASEDEEETTTSDLACEWLGTTNALGTDDSENTYTVESVVSKDNAYGVFQKTTLTSAGISSDDDETSTASEDAESYTYYILQQHSGDETPKFYKVGSTNVTVGAYRAYLALSSSESSDAESIAFTFVESNEVTGIGSVSAEQTVGSGLYYDLQGRQVRTPQKGGIYIKDGKKVII